MMEARRNCIREELKKIAGVEPSRHWLKDCCNHLQSTNQNNAEAVSADAVLDQILHQDLRDVVRVFDENEQPAVAMASRGSKKLRRALRESISSSNRKAVMPASDDDGEFRLLVQVEELLDVTLNADSRLAAGRHRPNNGNAPPTAAANQQNHRCLKLFVSDGYCEDDRNSTSSSNSQENRTPSHLNARDHNSNRNRTTFLVAMEVSHIPKLSVNSLAGTKVLLTGPMEIRHGVMFWNTGNAHVLGGSVREMVRLQTQALKQAMLRAGVGVDATVRALIGNDPDNAADLLQLQDEAEHESGDVVASVAPPPPPDMTAIASSSPPPPLQQAPLNGQTPAVEIATRGFPPNSSNIINRNEYMSTNQSRARSSRGLSTNSVANTFQQQQQHRGINPYATAKKNNSATTNLTTTIAPAPSFSGTPMDVDEYNYAASASVVGSSVAASTNLQNSSSTTIAAVRRPQPPQERTGINPYATSSKRNAVASCMVPSSSPHSTTVRASAKDTNAESRSNSEPPRSDVASCDSQTLSTSGTQVERISFADLRNLLAQAVANDTIVQQNHGKTYRCKLQQKGAKLYFNIEKNKNHKKGHKSKKYEYVMTAKFGSDNNTEGLITCKVANGILEPFFVHSPGDMRKLSRQRGKTEELIKEGGRKVQEFTKTLSDYDITLLQLQGKEQNATIDGLDPVLLLVKRYK